jgi:glycosyltransferase involved in cell wall biosynthesis
MLPWSASDFSAASRPSSSVLASIIVATRNRSAALGDTLRAIARVPVPAGLMTEVLVIDNGSTDDTRAQVVAAAVASPAIKYLVEPVAGKSFALNTALQAARGEILAFLDDDVRPGHDWLNQVTAPLVDRRADAVAGAVRIAPHLQRPWMRSTHRTWLASTHAIDPAAPQSAVGANFAIRRGVLARVPAFDVELGPGRLGLWEDTLFIAQLLRAGYRLTFAPAAAVEHHFDPSRLLRRAFLTHARNQGRSAAYVSWHWDHADRPPGMRGSTLYYRLRLRALRIFRHRDCAAAEGMAVWEMDLLSGIAFADHFRAEQRRARAYGRPAFAPPAISAATVAP